MARRSWYYRVAVKLVLVIFGILGASAAQAQNAPWCLQTSSLGGYQSCTYATFEQCLVDRAAKNGFCTQNSTYGGVSSAIFPNPLPPRASLPGDVIVPVPTTAYCSLSLFKTKTLSPAPFT